MGVDARMIVTTKTKITEDQIVRWSYEIGGAFDRETFFIIRPENEWGWEPRRALEIVDVYEQDGDDVVANKGETIIKVNLDGRYYGPGYERGDFPVLRAVAEWLEAKIPEAEVFYGGDSSGVCAEPFGKKARDEMTKHWIENGRRPYVSYHEESGPICDFCHEPTIRFGWGGSYAAYFCYGCGWEIETRDNGKTYVAHNSEF